MPMYENLPLDPDRRMTLGATFHESKGGWVRKVGCGYLEREVARPRV